MSQLPLSEVGLRASIGIASGHALVGNVGTLTTRFSVIVGDVVNRVRRIERSASGGFICLDFKREERDMVGV